MCYYEKYLKYKSKFQRLKTGGGRIKTVTGCLDSSPSSRKDLRNLDMDKTNIKNVNSAENKIILVLPKIILEAIIREEEEAESGEEEAESESESGSGKDEEAEEESKRER